MEESQIPAEIQKNLIKINSELPSFKNNARAVSALQEFVSSPFLNKVCLNCSCPLLLKAFFELVEKSAKFSFIRLNPKLDNLEDSLRKSILLCIKSTRDVYEGEVVDIKQIKDDNNVLQHIEMTLKTMKASKTISLCKNLINLVNNVNIGDVIYVEPNSGILKRIGRSETRINEYDLEGDKHIQLSKGNVHSTREKEIYLSLYDFDYAFNKYNENITDFTRRHVDETVLDYMRQGIAQFVCSGVFIENAKTLDPTNIYRLLNVSNLYPHLKILTDSVESESVLRDSFLCIDTILEEKLIDILPYFSKKAGSEEFREIVNQVATYENYESVISALLISENVDEFKQIFN